MLYLIVWFNFILRLSVTLFHESKGLCRGLRSLVFRFISGILGVIHRDFHWGAGVDPLEGKGASRHSLLSGRSDAPQRKRPLGWRFSGQRFGQVENESVVDGDLVCRPNGTTVARQALSIRDVAA